MMRLAPISVQSEPRTTITQFMKLVEQVLSDNGKEIYECDQYPLPTMCIVTDGIRNDVPMTIRYGYNRHQKRFYESGRFHTEFTSRSAFESRLYEVIKNYMKSATLRGTDYSVSYSRKQLTE